MGGMGSGSWTRYASKNTVESRNSLSVQFLKKQGCLQAGNNGTFSWSRDGEPCGSVGYWVKANGIQLNYRNRSSEHAEWVDVVLFIKFDHTPCNYGNQRTWLLCPHCHQRVAILYSEGKYFLCRKCSQLNYQSQHLQAYERRQVMAESIRKQLGGDFSSRSPFPDKPKWMHWKTYWRHQSKTCRYETGALEGQMLALERINKMFDKMLQRRGNI